MDEAYASRRVSLLTEANGHAKQDANVRFFSAHTAQVKISRDWYVYHTLIGACGMGVPKVDCKNLPVIGIRCLQNYSLRSWLFYSISLEELSRL